MFESLTAVDLGVTALKGLLERTGVAPDAVEDVILGHCYPNSEAPAIGRVVALDAGLPVTVPGMQVDRRCGSGLQAVIQACLQVASGRQRSRRRRRRGEHEQRRVLLHRHALGRQAARRAGARRSGPRPHHRGRQVLPGARRHARDRREPAPPVRHLRARSRTSSPSPRTSGRSPRSRAASSPRRSSGVTVSTRQGEQVIDTDEHPRADTTRRVAGQAQTGSGQAGSGRHRDGRQRQRPERRRLDVHRHHPGEGRRARPDTAGAAGVVGVGRRGARTSWASARYPPPKPRWARPACR